MITLRWVCSLVLNATLGGNESRYRPLSPRGPGRRAWHSDARGFGNGRQRHLSTIPDYRRTQTGNIKPLQHRTSVAISDYVFDRMVEVEAVDEKSRSHDPDPTKEQKKAPEPVTRGGPTELASQWGRYKKTTPNLTSQQVGYPRQS